jgi:hypothetical protein
VHELDRDGGAQDGVRVVGRRAGGEEDQQRAQALAAGRDRRTGVLGQDRAVGAGELS